MPQFSSRKGFIAVALVCMLSAACTRETERTSPFQVAETRQRINHFRADVYWLDDNTLVFAGADTGPIKNGEPSAFPDEKAGIYIWKMGSDPAPYKAGAWPQTGTRVSENYLCAANGKIMFSTRAYIPTLAGFEVPVMEGQIGREAPSSFRYYRSDPAWSRPVVDDVVGKRCDQFHFEGMKDRRWQISHLREQVLDMGPAKSYESWEPRPVQIPTDAVFRLIDVRSGNVRPVSGIDPHWALPGCEQPLSWEKAFVTWVCAHDTSEKGVDFFPVWKIRSDGSVERIDAHLGNLVGPQLVPFRDGYLFVSWGRYGSNEDAAGIYLLANGRLKKIASGNYRAKAISPNGCLGAFSNSVQFAFGGVFDRLTVFDFCKMRASSQ